MPDKPWKRFETWVARQFGCERRPGSGAHGYNTAKRGTDDIVHPIMYGECKSLKKLLTHTLFRKARRLAKVDGKRIPIVALHEKGTPFHECLICCRVGDLLPLAIIRGITEDKEARKQMAEHDQAPPFRRWKRTFSERFVSELMDISSQMGVDPHVLEGGVKRYEQFKGAKEAQTMFDDMMGGDVEKMTSQIDGDWNKPTAQEDDMRKRKEGDESD